MRHHDFIPFSVYRIAMGTAVLSWMAGAR